MRTRERFIGLFTLCFSVAMVGWLGPAQGASTAEGRISVHPSVSCSSVGTNCSSGRIVDAGAPIPLGLSIDVPDATFATIEVIGGGEASGGLGGGFKWLASDASIDVPLTVGGQAQADLVIRTADGDVVGGGILAAVAIVAPQEGVAVCDRQLLDTGTIEASCVNGEWTVGPGLFDRITLAANEVPSLEAVLVTSADVSASFLGMIPSMEISAEYGASLSGGWRAQIVDVTIIPIPGAAWLFGTALAGLGIMGRRGKRAA